MSKQKKSDKKYPVEKLLLITATLNLIEALIEIIKELI